MSIRGAGGQIWLHLDRATRAVQRHGHIVHTVQRLVLIFSTNSWQENQKGFWENEQAAEELLEARD